MLARPNAFQRCYLKAHYVIVLNSQCSLCPWRIWLHLTVQTIPFLKVMHGHVEEQQYKWEKCSSKPSLICICQLSPLRWLKTQWIPSCRKGKYFCKGIGYRWVMINCLPAPLPKRLREGRWCFGPWECTKEQHHKKLLTRSGACSDIQASVFSLSYSSTCLLSLNHWLCS